MYKNVASYSECSLTQHKRQLVYLFVRKYVWVIGWFLVQLGLLSVLCNSCSHLHYCYLFTFLTVSIQSVNVLNPQLAIILCLILKQQWHRNRSSSLSGHSPTLGSTIQTLIYLLRNLKKSYSNKINFKKIINNNQSFHKCDQVNPVHLCKENCRQRWHKAMYWKRIVIKTHLKKKSHFSNSCWY